MQERVWKLHGTTCHPSFFTSVVMLCARRPAPVAGMMDTVLNLGLNDQTVEALAKKSGDRRFAFDSS